MNETALLGLTLEQYAGVEVALAEGFDPARVLANENLPPSVWRKARSAWATKISREGPGSALERAFLGATDEARGWLGRRIDPLDRDLAAYLAFSSALAQSDVPAEVLRSAGMRRSDVTALARTWSSRLAADEELRTWSTELARSIAPAIPPDLRIEPATLRPYRWSRPRNHKGGASTSLDTRAESLPVAPPIRALPTFLLPNAEPVSAGAWAGRGTVRGGTAAVSDAMTDAPLPFSANAGAPTATTRTDLPDAPHRGGTQEELRLEPRRPTLPFDSEARDPAVGAAGGITTVEEYARFCTELGLWPDRIDDILRRYGLTPQSRVATDASFRGLMATDADAYGRWFRASEAYLGTLLGRPRHE